VEGKAGELRWGGAGAGKEPDPRGDAIAVSGYRHFG
jgi:hypothetical protein